MCPPHLDSDVSFVFERLKICNRLNVFLTEMRWYLQVWPARAAVRGARDSLPLFRRECWSGSGPHIPGEIEGSSGECLRCHPCIVDRAPHRVMPAVPGLWSQSSASTAFHAPESVPDACCPTHCSQIVRIPLQAFYFNETNYEWDQLPSSRNNDFLLAQTDHFSTVRRSCSGLKQLDPGRKHGP
jgi:hypothetical protein